MSDKTKEKIIKCNGCTWICTPDPENKKIWKIQGKVPAMNVYFTCQDKQYFYQNDFILEYIGDGLEKSTLLLCNQIIEVANENIQHSGKRRTEIYGTKLSCETAFHKIFHMLEYNLPKPKLIIDNICVINAESFLQQSDMDDIIFEIEDIELHLNKTILAYNSPVFKAMFFGNFKESTDKKITLKKNILRFIDFLSSFYNVDLTTQTMNSRFSCLRATRLYSLYKEYQMDVYIEFCEHLFREFYRHLTSRDEIVFYIDVVLKHGVLAEKFDLPWLLEKAINHASQVKSTDWKDHKLWKKLTEETRFKILFKLIERENL